MASLPFAIFKLELWKPCGHFHHNPYIGFFAHSPPNDENDEENNEALEAFNKSLETSAPYLARIEPPNLPHVGYFRHSTEFGSWLYVDEDGNLAEPPMRSVNIAQFEPEL